MGLQPGSGGEVAGVSKLGYCEDCEVEDEPTYYHYVKTDEWEGELELCDACSNARDVERLGPFDA